MMFTLIFKVNRTKMLSNILIIQIMLNYIKNEEVLLRIGSEESF